MKKLIILPLLIFCVKIVNAQITQTRDDAGLRGDAGATSGFFEAYNPVNYPAGAASWWHLLDVRHSNNSNNYAMQFAGSFSDQQLWFRKTNNAATQPWSKVVLETNGNVGIGTTIPRAFLDVGRFSDNGALGTVMGRLEIGDAVGDGTYLGVRGFEAQNQNYNNKSFALEHSFFGNVNSSINFYRGGDGYGGFVTFSTNNNIEKMRIDKNGNLGVGTANPQAKLHVQADANTSSAPSNAQLFVTGSTHPDKRLSLAYNTSSNYAELQSQAYDGGYTPIVLNPNGGNVGIGTTTTTAGEKLSVNGKIRAKEIKVEVTGWPDYVFEENYRPKTLTEIAAFIKMNKHLPEVPSAKEVEQNGVELGEMNKILLKKIEEMTLLLIEQNNKLEKQGVLIEKLIAKEGKN